MPDQGENNKGCFPFVVGIATVFASVAAVQQTTIQRMSHEANVKASKEAGEQVQGITEQALTLIQEQADARIKPIVVVPPGDYVLPLVDKFPASFLAARKRESDAKLHPGEIYVNALPVKNYGGGPATGVTSIWDFDFGCSGEERLTPATLAPGDTASIPLAQCLPEYPTPGRKADEALPGYLKIICKDVNRKQIQTDAPFTFKKYGATPVPHIHIEVRDYVILPDCPDCGRIDNYGTQEVLGLGESEAAPAAPPAPADHEPELAPSPSEGPW